MVSLPDGKCVVGSGQFDSDIEYYLIFWSFLYRTYIAHLLKYWVAEEL